MSILADNILLPSSSTMSNSTNNNTAAAPAKKPINIGSTWNDANIKIDFDNLISTKSTKGPAPSMNQLKSANTSPVKSTMPSGLTSPMGNNSNFMFSQQSNNNNNNNNNFNQFNAFQ